METTVGDSSNGLVKDVADLQTAISETGSLGADVKTLKEAAAGYDGTNTIAKAIQNAADVSAAANATTNAIAVDAQTKANTLIGNNASDTNKSVRDIANLVISEALTDGGEDFDTLQEIAAWIKDHPEDAAAMNAAIDSIKQNLGYTVNESGAEVVPATVDNRIAAAISSAEQEINDQIAALNNKVDTDDQKVSEYVEAAKQAAISAAQADATSKANAAQAAAEATAAADATAKANQALADARTDITALAGTGNQSTVARNADAIAGLDTSIKAMNASFGETSLGENTEGAIVTGITQVNGTITTVTQRKVKNVDLDQNDVFVFYCGQSPNNTAGEYVLTSVEL